MKTLKIINLLNDSSSNSDTYILVTCDTMIPGACVDTNLAFQNCAPFSAEINRDQQRTEINDTCR